MENSKLYSGRVNSQWARLMDIMGMDVNYSSCKGMELVTEDGNTYKDFLSGYCVQNLGHNNKYIADALIDEIKSQGPVILQNLIPRYAGELAEKIVTLAGRNISNVCFTNTGSEGVEIAIKFTRLHTKRAGILYSEGAFHGISYGAMSLMKNTSWTKRFGPFLEDTMGVPFLDVEKIEKELKTKKYAAFITELIQSEAGLNIAKEEKLKEVQSLCKKYGTLFIADEVQSGIFRTGKFLATHYFDIEPDMIILAKALGGGMMPVGAVLMKEEINRSVFKSIDQAFVSASTFGENSLSMRAALSTLEYCEKENISERCLELGESLREGVNALVPKYEMLKEVRGIGLMNGIVFQEPHSLKLKALFKSFKLLHEGLFGQMMVRKLFREGKILTQVCGNNYMVIKACPPLISIDADIKYFVNALDQALESFHSGDGFKEGIAIGRKVLNL